MCGIEQFIQDIEKTYLTSYAQWGEDIILHKLLSHVNNGSYVDIGCADPFFLSVSCIFYKRGWRGLNIDPRSDAISEHQKARPEDINLCTAVSNKHGIFPFWEWQEMSTFDEPTVRRLGIDKFKRQDVEMTTLTDILEEYMPERAIHFMKIDVEQHEKEVILGLDLKKFRPWVFAVECTLPGTAIPAWEEWEAILFANQYKFILMHGINRFYAASEKYDEIMANFAKNQLVPYMLDAHKLFLREQLDELRSMELKTQLPAAASHTSLSECPRDLIDELLSLLRPENDHNSEQIVEDADGFCFIAQEPSDTICYNCGQSAKLAFEMAKRGYKTFHVQNTDQEIKDMPSTLGFIRKNLSISPQDTANEISIANLLRLTGAAKAENLLLSVDMKSDEWKLLYDIDSQLLKNFNQIIINIYNISVKDTQNQLINILKKLHPTHKSVYLTNYSNGTFTVSNLLNTQEQRVIFLRR